MDRGRCKNKFKIKHKWTHLYCGWKQMVCLRKMWYMTTWIGEGGRGGRGVEERLFMGCPLFHSWIKYISVSPKGSTSELLVFLSQYLLLNIDYSIFFREGEKNNRFFGRSLPNMGGWGCRFPNFRWPLPTTIFQHKSSQMWVGGAVKTQNQIQILGKIY